MTGPSPTRSWRVLQGVALLVLLLIAVDLGIRSERALSLLWNVLIPLIPALLLISPAIWRNICPLATLNMMSNREGTTAPSWSAWAGGAGVVLLMLLVPARRFLFNSSPSAALLAIILLVAVALMLGGMYPVKSGFCNALCPILPVERLYGHQPLIQIQNTRCVPCTVCTSRGCIDLAPHKSTAQTLGPSRRTNAWLLTPFGAFGAAFPGFVLGYFLVPDGALATAPRVYAVMLGWAAASYLVTTLVVRITGSSAERTITSNAGLAAGLYYWHAAPGMSVTLGLGPATTAWIRLAALTLVLVWIFRTRSYPRGAMTPLATTTSTTGQSS